MNIGKESILLIDAGGTYVKTAIAEGNKIFSERIFETNNFQIDEIKKLIDEHNRENLKKKKSSQISFIMIACAGPVKGGKCQLVNANLFFDEKVISVLAGVPVKIINDLEAAAYYFKKENRNSAVIGLGTGLGVSIIDSSCRVIASEEGHCLIDRELFLKVPELRNTIIPQYEYILGARKNILSKLLKRNEKGIKLSKPDADRFSEIYLQVLTSFINQIISAHKDAKIKKVILVGGVASGNIDFLKKYSAELKKKIKAEINFIEDKFLGVKGAFVYYLEKEGTGSISAQKIRTKTEKLINVNV